jgi:hypothetical protein
MRGSRLVPLAALALVLVAPVLAYSRGGQAPPMPKPGPEHEVFKMDVGTWDAVVELTPGPGAPPMTSKGVEVNRLGCGGLCLVTEFKGEMMGDTFLGHGLMTWDVAKKKYVGSWTDSMSGGLAVTEGTFEPGTRRFTGTMEGPDATGNVMKTRSVVEYPNGGRVMTAYAPGPDGKEMQVLKITYKRRK